MVEMSADFKITPCQAWCFHEPMPIIWLLENQ